MIRVEMTNVSPYVQGYRTIITLPDDQWARMCAVHPASDVPIVRTVTASFDGTRIIVDAHRGGSVIVWRETRPCDTCDDEARPGRDTCAGCDPFNTPTCAICDGAHRGADCTDPARMGGRVTGLPA